MFPFSSQRQYPFSRGKAERNRKFKSRKPTLEMLEDRTVPSTLSALAPKSPLGSLAYETTGSGLISMANPNDSASLSLDAGQTISVAVTPPAYWASSGHYYTTTSGSLTWQDAEAEAVALGGHLVTINSQAEQDFLNTTFFTSAYGQSRYWIGLNDAAVEGTFVWSSGEPMTYTNWQPTEPNNLNNEDYAIMYTPPTGWNDGQATDMCFGVIELPASSALRANVTVSGPGGVLATKTASTAGEMILLQDIPVTTAGTYTVTVSGVGGSTGEFHTRVLLNGAFEAESYGGSDNGSQSSAQDLDASFQSIGDAQHAAVSGSLPGNTGITFVGEDFEGGSLGSNWSTYSSLSTGRIQVTGSYGAASGTKALVMDDTKARGAQGLNEAVWTVDLAGQSQVTLSFAHASWNDEVTGFSGSFTGHANADGIAISADGINWYPAWTPPVQAAGTWQSYMIDLAAIAAQNGISLGSNFRIKFQQYGAEPLTKDGRGWDNLRILVPDPASTANEDWYRFTLSANESTTVTVTPQGSGKAHIQIYDANGLKLFDGDSTPTNVGEVVSFTAPTAGSYYARISGNDFYSTSGVDYNLTVTAGATFDLEDNSGPQPWAGGGFQVIDASQGVLGALRKEPVTPFVSLGSGGLANPEKMVFRDGYLYVASLGTAQVMRYDAATGAPRPSPGHTGAVFATGGMNSPKGLAFGSDGNLYVGDHLDSAVYRFDGTTGAFIDTFIPSGTGGLDHPQGLLFDQDGNLFITSNFPGRVLRFKPDGTPFPSAGNTGAIFATGGGLDEPDGITFGPDGNLYVASLAGRCVYRFNATTGAFIDKFVATGSGGLSNASDVAFAEDGTLFVTGFGAGAVFHYQGPFGENPGSFLDVVVPKQSLLANLTTLEFGPDGALYITNHISHSVLRANFGSDFYRVSLQPGEVFTAETATPFAGANLPTNNLDPVLRLYDSNGNLLATDENGMSDLHNARLWYQSSAGGDYYIEVAARVDTSGEYFLNTAVYPSASPLLVIDNISMLEGDSGTTNAQFIVTLLNPPSGDLSVDYTTADGTALAGSDYATISGTLTFTEGGPTTQTISVPITGDQTEEAHEQFLMQLSNATAGAEVAFDGKASSLVLNDDTTVSIGGDSPPVYWEGNGHYYTTTSGSLTWQDAEAEAVALGGHLVTINSQAEQDFLNSTFFTSAYGQSRYWIGLNDAAVEGTFVWSSGEPVTYTNWQPNEPNNLNNEDYAIMYTPPTGWNDGKATDMCFGVIELPDLTGVQSDVTVVEGDSGTRSARFTVTLSSPSALPVSVQYATADGSATAASGDYVQVPLTTVTFAPGQTIRIISVAINGDSNPEANETFFVNLSNPTGGATISDGQAVATIANDDVAGSASDMYVWDIGYETRQRGSKTDLRLLVTARSDSDADGIAEATDAVVSGASVTVQLSGPSNATLSGTTNSSGQFISSWISNVSNGTYVAEVTDLQASSLTWNKNLDPTGNDTDLDNDNLPDQQIPIGSALVANSLGSNPSAKVLSESQYQPLVQEAQSRYVATGADLSALNNLNIQIADLPGATLGLASGNTIFLDTNAAGWGWFIDPTPHDDLEFMLPGNQGEQGRMDLLTVIMHEMGHVLGHDHEDHGVMQETLSAGQRYSLEGMAFQDAVPATTDSWLSQQYYLDSMLATLASEAGGLRK